MSEFSGREAAAGREAALHPGRSLDEADYRALAEFRSVLRRFMAFSDAAALAAGLTPQRYQALLAIRVRAQDQPLSVGALSKELLIKPHSAAELVNRLEAADLVRRASDKVDRRRVLLALTPQGEKLISDLASAQMDELVANRAALLEIVASLQHGSASGPPKPGSV